MIQSIADGDSDGEKDLRAEERMKHKQDRLRREFLRKELNEWSVSLVIGYHSLLVV